MLNIYQLEQRIQHVTEAQHVVGMALAIIQNAEVTYARGFGVTSVEDGSLPVTPHTLFCIGSISKTLTATLIMRLVEQGKLDLDAPVTKYLPDFKPGNRFDTPVTLRQLMAHRSGLVREPPVGHYFDDSAPSLARTVRSLNRSEVVYAPGSRTKYSNAGVAAVGLVLEEAERQPFARYLSRTLLVPLGMGHSTFEPDPAITKDLARAVMWTYHGREFPAPTFELGTAPAGSMYSTANDLARFLSVLFAGGKGRGGSFGDI